MAELVSKTQIPKKFLEALEEDRLETFSAKVYALGVLKKALVSLGVQDTENFLQELRSEWDIRNYRSRRELSLLPQNGIQKPLITPGRLGLLAGILFLIFFLGFFGLRFNHFLGTPELSVVLPADESVFEEPIVPIKGKTEKESRLTVNGREVTIDKLGNFGGQLELGAGLHLLEFITQDRFGKEAREVRKVIIK